GTIGTDSRAVRAATELGDNFVASIWQDAGERLTPDLDEQYRTVRHRDGTFGKLQSFCDHLELHLCSSSEQSPIIVQCEPRIRTIPMSPSNSMWLPSGILTV